MRFIFYLFCFIFINTTAQSIVNTEKLFNPDNRGLLISSSLAGNFVSGNNDLLMVDYSINFSYQKQKNTFMILTSGEHIRENKEDPVTSQITGQFRYVYNFHDKWKVFSFLQAQTLGILLLDERWLVGGGLRTRLLDRDFLINLSQSIKLDFSFGVMQEKEVLDQSMLPDLAIVETNYTRAIFSVISVIEVSDVINLINTTYFQQYVRDMNDYRFFHELNLVFKTNEWLSLSLDFEYRFDSDPPSVLKHKDYNTNVGFVFEF